MTSRCVLCFVPDGVEPHPAEPGWSCCQRAHDRMLAALRDIPLLVDELSGLGYVERDTRRRRCARHGCRWPAEWRGADSRSGRVSSWCGGDAERMFVDGQAFGFWPVSSADPVANVLTAGPTNGASNAPRVNGGGAVGPVPIRVDSTDLLAPARPASLAVAEAAAFDAEGRPTGRWPQDQIGHLAVATELEFWARDWADARGERLPLPTVRALAPWLLDRLDWACAEHPALDEFAEKLTHLRTVLTAATGRLPARPELVDRPCPSCGWMALFRPPDGRYIECGHCARVLTDDEYRDHLEDVIKTNWTVVDPDDARTWPPDRALVWLRAADGVTVGFTADFIANGLFLTMWGKPLDGASHWAPISYPADPGPAKDDAA